MLKLERITIDPAVMGGKPDGERANLSDRPGDPAHHGRIRAVPAGGAVHNQPGALRGGTCVRVVLAYGCEPHGRPRAEGEAGVATIRKFPTVAPQGGPSALGFDFGPVSWGVAPGWDRAGLWPGNTKFRRDRQGNGF